MKLSSKIIIGILIIAGIILLASKFSISGNAAANINPNVQEINMQVDYSGYSPNSFVIKQGVPVKWNIDMKQLTGCNSELIVSEYNIDKKLQQGLNVIEFTPTKIGTISFTCGMGMLRGSFIVTEDGTASQNEIQAAAPKSSGSCNMGAGGSSCGCGGAK